MAADVEEDLERTRLANVAQLHQLGFIPGEAVPLKKGEWSFFYLKYTDDKRKDFVLDSNGRNLCSFPGCSWARKISNSPSITKQAGSFQDHLRLEHRLTYEDYCNFWNEQHRAYKPLRSVVPVVGVGNFYLFASWCVDYGVPYAALDDWRVKSMREGAVGSTMAGW